MKSFLKFMLYLLLMLAFLVGCGGNGSDQTAETLTLTDGTSETTYTVDELESLGGSLATFGGVTYLGVPLVTLMQDAGFDPAAVSAVKATANDGFSANYGTDLINRDDTLVAYAQAAGSLTEDDGHFRMVLPNQEGKLNVRQLVSLQIIR